MEYVILSLIVGVLTVAPRTTQHARRGSALPETAMSISLIMLVFLGLIKLTLLGFDQSQSDAAAFVASHAAALATPSGSATSNPLARAIAKTQAAGLPTGNISVAASSANGMVGYVYRNSGGLFTNQAFGGTVFNLHSRVIEPMPQAAYTAAPSVTIVQALPPNCTTNNVATNNASGYACATLSLATPNPSASDQFYEYACRAMYYAVLSSNFTFVDGTSSPQTEDLLSYSSSRTVLDYSLADASSLTNLTDENGNALQDEHWPHTYDPGTGQSINDPNMRASDKFFTTQTYNGALDQNNADGLSNGGGTVGTYVKPIFDFGTANSKC